MLEFYINLRNRVVTRHDEKGAVAIEYAALVAFVALVLGAALVTFGSEITTWIEGLASKVAALFSGGGTPAE